MALGFKSKITNIVDADTPMQATQSGGMRVVKDMRIENARVTPFYELTEADPSAGPTVPYLRTYFASQSGYVSGTTSNNANFASIYKTIDDSAGLVFLSHPNAMATYGYSDSNTLLGQFVDSTTGEVWDACVITTSLPFGVSYLNLGAGNYNGYRVVVDWIDAGKTHLFVQTGSKVTVVRVDKTNKTLVTVQAFSLNSNLHTLCSTTTDFTMLEFGHFGSTSLQYKLHTFDPATGSVSSSSTLVTTGHSVYSSSYYVHARRVNASADEYVLVYDTGSNSTKVEHAAVDLSNNSVSWGGATTFALGTYVYYCDIISLSAGNDFAYALVTATTYTSWNTSYPSTLVFGTAVSTAPSYARLNTYTGSTSYYLYSPTLMSLGNGYYALGAQARPSGSNSGCYILQKGSSSVVNTVYQYNQSGRILGALDGAVYYTYNMRTYKVVVSQSGTVTASQVTDPTEFAIGVHIPALTGMVRGKTYVFHPHRGHMLFNEDGTLFSVSYGYGSIHYTAYNVITGPQHVGVKYLSDDNQSATNQVNTYFQLFEVSDTGVVTSKFTTNPSSYAAASDMSFDSAYNNFYYAVNYGTTTGYLYMYKVPLSSYTNTNIYGASNASYPYTGAWFFDDQNRLLFYRSINNNTYQIWNTSGSTVGGIKVAGQSIGTGNVYATAAGGMQVHDGTTLHNLSYVAEHVFYQTVTNGAMTPHVISNYGTYPQFDNQFVSSDLALVKWQTHSGAKAGVHVPSGTALPDDIITAPWVTCGVIHDAQPGIIVYNTNSGTYTIEYIAAEPISVDVSVSTSSGSVTLTKGVVIAPGDVVALDEVFYLDAGEDLFVECDTRRAAVVYSAVLDNA